LNASRVEGINAWFMIGVRRFFIIS